MAAEREVAHLIDELTRPAAYPRPVSAVECRQTHISLLFFTPDRVYKVKKPVDLGFLDFTDLARRRHYCEQEVRLNRRMAPDVYLGVVPITRGGDGRLRVGGDGQAVEWAVEMVRLPEQRMLAALLDRGEVDNQQMNLMAAMLADFHARCPTGPGVDEHGAPEAVAANVEQNFEQLERFVGSAAAGVLTPVQHAFLRERASAFLRGRRDLLERRVREGRIREGHGDLHAENICFTDQGPLAYDCIEFSPAFRCGDVAADLAFLAMDLDQRGYPGFSAYLVRRYVKLTGDAELRSLEVFYKAYRALVRAKVAALTAADPAVGQAQRGELRGKAMRYVQLAAAYDLPPALILMCGLPASGKSWLARRLAGSLRAAVLQSDVRRKSLSGMAPTAHVEAGYEQGLYAPEKKEETYRSLLADALGNLRSGHAVIVDASFSRRRYRAPFLEAAARQGSPCFVVRVDASDAVTRERLTRRAQDPRRVSDAGLAVYEKEQSAFEPPTEVPPGQLVEIASGEGIPEERSSLVVDRMIASRGPSTPGHAEG